MTDNVLARRLHRSGADLRVELQEARRAHRLAGLQPGRHVGRVGQRLAKALFMLKGIAAGIIGGLAGTWAMSEAQRAWTRAVDGEAPESAAGKHDARDWQERSEGQNSNELAAQAVARRVLGRGLTKQELGVAAPLVHYMFGAAMGALYGAYAQRRQTAGSGAGDPRRFETSKRGQRRGHRSDRVDWALGRRVRFANRTRSDQNNRAGIR